MNGIPIVEDINLFFLKRISTPNAFPSFPQVSSCCMAKTLDGVTITTRVGAQGFYPAHSTIERFERFETNLP